MNQRLAKRMFLGLKMGSDPMIFRNLEVYLIDFFQEVTVILQDGNAVTMLDLVYRSPVCGPVHIHAVIKNFPHMLDDLVQILHDGTCLPKRLDFIPNFCTKGDLDQTTNMWVSP